MSALPQIDQEVVNGLFAALSLMEVELDENPLDYGPRRLNNKVAQARRMLTETEGLYLKVAQWIQKYKAAHRTAETLMNLEIDNKLASDPEVRAARNLDTQKAIARVKLRGLVEDPDQFQSVLDDLSSLMNVVKAKRADLKDVQARIRDQIKLCHDEIGMGSRWGTKPPPGSKAPDLDAAPDPNKKTLRDLTEMFHGNTSEIDDILNSPEAPPEKDPAPPAENEAVGVFPEPLVIEDHPRTGLCEVCREPQYRIPSGTVCKNGHGGAGTLPEEEAEPTPLRDLLPVGSAGDDSQADAFLEALEEDEADQLPKRQELDIDAILGEFNI